MLRAVTDKEPPEGSTHRLTITNEKTGEVEINLGNIKGGIFIAHRADDESPMGTDQGAFGWTSSIVLCALKIRPIVHQMLKLRSDIREVYEEAKKLADAAGIETT